MTSEEKLVLPSGIEPPTSPLPRVCSTTELRQQDQTREAETLNSRERGGYCHSFGRSASRKFQLLWE